ncbi:hypothetical protein [Marinicella meishanensis]|uniref:hypothetical protein n=1 Tax=Marinicella meishanensis TaxID=2873263 RepID=UPI001CBBF928|nr:hypothetical protein [Marinicella sp. NBU2979]
MEKFKMMLAATTLMMGASAMAGTVKLESPKLEHICQVQVTTGQNRPNQLVHTYTNVSKGFTVSGEDRLCYRRSAKPAQCDANYTEWTCMQRKGSGTSVLKLS